MFHDEFFPTPREIAERMWRMTDTHRKKVLDPSCGKGDLLKGLDGDFYYEYKDDVGYYTRAEARYGIEVVPELQELARAQGITIIGTDYLTTKIDISIDVILMNPPFSNGDEHLLKAFNDVKDGGVVICLLNAETVLNPYSKKRKQLVNLIEKYGSYENWGPCFSNAERPTDVHIICVKLIKPEENRFEYKGDNFAKETREQLDSQELVQAGGLIKPDILSALERAYDQSKVSFAELLIAISKVQAFTNTFRSERGYSLDIYEILSTRSSKEDKYDTFIAALRRRAWEYIFEKTKLREIATSSLRKDFDKFLEEQGNIAFTKENIIAVMEMLYFNKNQYLLKAVYDVFEKLISYDKENKIHWEGWKTNDAYKVNYKVIIPYVIEYEKQFTNKWHFSYNANSNFLQDIDIALCHVTERDVNKIYELREAIKDQFKIANNNDVVENHQGESTFFKFRFFKKGTLHLWFKEEEVWMRFNIMAAAGKGWLPPNDIKAQERREKENKKKQKFADAAWNKIQKQQEKEEKLRKQRSIEFYPANSRGTLLIDKLKKAGFTHSYHESSDCLTVKRKGEYDLEYNGAVVFIYRGEEKLGFVSVTNPDGSIKPINDLAAELIPQILDEEPQDVLLTQPTLF